MIGSTTSFGDTLTSLADSDDDDKPEMTSSTAREDDVLLVSPSSDVHDMSVVVQLTHGNIMAVSYTHLTLPTNREV